MTVFSPTALMRVLTTLVDRSLDEPPATPARMPARKSRRARFSPHGQHAVTVNSRPHLKLVARADDDVRRDAE